MHLQLVLIAALFSADARNPYAGQPNAIRAGEKLYQRHCSSCHGPAMKSNATEAELFELLRHGRLRKGMPSWSSLPPERRWQIITYLQSRR